MGETTRQPRVILGIDPGISLIGYSFFRDGELTGYGIWTPKSKRERVSDNLIEKMRDMYDILNGEIDQRGVTHIACELVPSFGQMAHQAKILAIQNLIRTVCFSRGLKYVEYPPVSMKKQFAGSGKASKDEVKARVLELYKVPEEKPKLKPDVFDAIAIGHLGVNEPEGNYWNFGRGGQWSSMT